MPYKKKPRVLKRKNVKRKTGAKAQSKQIMALSKQVSSLTKSNYETVMTVWSRNNLSVDKTLAGVSAYICPMPKSMCNCFGQTTLATIGINDKRLKFSDNLGIAAQPFYQKKPCFNSSNAARNSHEANHMGGTLKWRLISDEPSFSTYDVFLISPKSRQADQLTTDRLFKDQTGAVEAGKNSKLVENTDFITHPEIFGSQINLKYWTVDAHRRCNFSSPTAQSFTNKATSANTSPRNNAIIQEGTFRLKPGGVLRCAQVQGNNTIQNNPISASQLGYLDEKNEKLQYLVIINNGLAADLETVNLSLLVRDYYKVVV